MTGEVKPGGGGHFMESEGNNPIQKMRERRLELLPLSGLDPKSSASANSATLAPGAPGLGGTFYRAFQQKRILLLFCTLTASRPEWALRDVLTLRLLSTPVEAQAPTRAVFLGSMLNAVNQAVVSTLAKNKRLRGGLYYS